MRAVVTVNLPSSRDLIFGFEFRVFGFVLCAAGFVFWGGRISLLGLRVPCVWLRVAGLRIRVSCSELRVSVFLNHFERRASGLDHAASASRSLCVFDAISSIECVGRTVENVCKGWGVTDQRVIDLF